MGGVRNREQKKKNAHVFSSGGGGGGGGPSTIDKRKTQEFPCAHCDRIFKQSGRLQDHIKKQHADTLDDGARNATDTTNQNQKQLSRASSSSSLASTSTTTTSSGSKPSTSAPPPPQQNLMDVGAKGGYYDAKTPKMLVQEWTLNKKLPKVRYRASEDLSYRPSTTTDDSVTTTTTDTTTTTTTRWKCKVVVPHPRNSQQDTVFFLPSMYVADSEDEAVQRAAVMALHHLAGDRAMDKLLPKQYVPMWKYLDDRKTKQIEQEQREEARRTSQAAAKKASANARRTPTTVVMTEEKRKIVEDILKQGRSNSTGDSATTTTTTMDGGTIGGQQAEGWTTLDSSSINNVSGDGDGGVTKNTIVDELVEELVALGFDEKDAVQGATSTSSSNETPLNNALDWLCIHIPEQRLPRMFAPGAAGAPLKVLSYNNKNLMTSSSSLNTIKQQNDEEEDNSILLEDPAIQNLVQYGYPPLWCAEALKERNGHVQSALFLLYSWLTSSSNHGGGDKNYNAKQEKEDDVERLKEWQEERDALKAIFDDQVEFHSSIWTVIKLPTTLPTTTSSSSSSSIQLELHAWAPSAVSSSSDTSQPYPYTVPVLAVQSIPHGSIASNTLLTLTRKLYCIAVESQGSPMLFDVASAAGEMIEDCVAHPMKEVSDLPPPLVAAVQLQQQQFDKQQPPLASSTNQNKTPPTLPPLTTTKPSNKPKPNRQQPTTIDITAENERLLQHHTTLQTSQQPHQLLLNKTRRSLPAYRQRTDVITAVQNSSVTVIRGATGCGKSTQVPQYILEDAIEKNQGANVNIVVTQPRRISAVGLAHRVAAERGEKVGDVVGYSVRLDSKRSYRTRVLFCTTGVLLRRLVNDNSLSAITHIVLDEVHERSIESDLLLMLLRDMLYKGVNTGLKVVLMSATADADLFATYFTSKLLLGSSSSKTNGGGCCSILNIPGFTYPVQDMYLEDVLKKTGFVVGKSSRWAKSGSSSSSSSSKKGDGGDDDKSSDGSSENSISKSVDNNNSYSRQTQQSLSNIDETLINIDLIEALVASIAADISHNNNNQQQQLIATSTDTKAENTTKSSSSSTQKANEANAILIFVPGSDDISRTVRTLESSSKVSTSYNGSRIKVLPLHGGLPPSQQSKVFERVPNGVLKIVVSTNVAETSITIDDITCVIDTGRAKEMRFDSGRGIARLQETWISQAAAKQRRGRAGRVRPGTCYRLFSHKIWSSTLERDTPPEVLRAPLQSLVMDIKGILKDSCDVVLTLQEMITPPESTAVRTAIRSLELIGALETSTTGGGGGALTPLGRHLTRMPCDPHIGKMLIYGAMLRCLDSVLTVAAAQGFGKPVFWSTPDTREEAEAARREITKSVSASKSDHLAVIAAYNGYRAVVQKAGGSKRAGSEYCQRGFTSEQAMEAITAGRAQYADILTDLGFISPGYIRNRAFSSSSSSSSDRGGGAGDDDHKRNKDEFSLLDEMSNSARVVKAALCAGLYPQLLRVEHPKAQFQKVLGGAVEVDASPSAVKFFDRERGRVFLHPSSINFQCGKFESGWLAYSDIVQTSKVFVRESSMVPVYAVLLFGGDVSVHHEKGVVKVDDWATFKAPGRIAVLVRELRSEASALLKRKIEDPRLDISKSRVVEAMHHLLSTDGF